jgi:hypothetical protein
MWTVLVVAFWGLAAGTVTAGLLSSFYELVTTRPVSFRLLVTGGLATSVIVMPLLLLSGPAVLARAGLDEARRDPRNARWLAVVGGLVLLWAFLNGVLVLEAALAVRARVA